MNRKKNYLIIAKHPKISHNSIKRQTHHKIAGKINTSSFVYIQDPISKILQQVTIFLNVSVISQSLVFSDMLNNRIPFGTVCLRSYKSGDVTFTMAQLEKTRIMNIANFLIPFKYSVYFETHTFRRSVDYNYFTNIVMCSHSIPNWIIPKGRLPLWTENLQTPLAKTVYVV